MENLYINYNDFIKDNADFFTYSFSQILNDSYSDYKFSNIIINCNNEYSFARAYFGFQYRKQYGTEPTYRDIKSLYILKNPHIDLPCFYTQKSFSLSDYRVELENKTNYYIIGRPEKLIKILFTTKVCEAITRMYKNSKCLNIEGVGEYIYLIYESHLQPVEFKTIKEDAIDLSSLFALNEEFNTDHIDKINSLEISY